MAAWKRTGGVPVRKRLIDGMVATATNSPFDQAIFQQMLGFGEYGFPESHAASFCAAGLRSSSWLKCHEPASFGGAAQQPAHGLLQRHRNWCRTRAATAARAADRCEPQRLGLHAGRTPAAAAPGAWRARACPSLAVRLGLWLVSNLHTDAAKRRCRPARRRRSALCQHGRPGPARCGLDRHDLQALAPPMRWPPCRATAASKCGTPPNQHRAPRCCATPRSTKRRWSCPRRPKGKKSSFDYAATGLTLRRHPLAFAAPAPAALAAAHGL